MENVDSDAPEATARRDVCPHPRPLSRLWERGERMELPLGLLGGHLTDGTHDAFFDLQMVLHAVGNRPGD